MHRFGILGNAVLHSHLGKDVCLRAGIDDHVCDKADSDSRPTERDSLGHSEFEKSRSSAPPNNIPDAMADLGEPDGHDEAAPASSSSNSVR